MPIESVETLTLKQLIQDKVSMDMSVLEFVNGQVVNTNTLIQHLMVGSMLPTKQTFTLVMTKELFRRINITDINIDDIFDFKASVEKESNIIAVRFIRL